MRGEKGDGVGLVDAAVAAVERQAPERRDAPSDGLLDELLEEPAEGELLEAGKDQVHLGGGPEMERLRHGRVELDVRDEDVRERVEPPDDLGQRLRGHVPVHRSQRLSTVGRERVDDRPKDVPHRPVYDEDLEVGAVPDDGHERVLALVHRRPPLGVVALRDVNPLRPPTQAGFAVQDLAQLPEFRGIVEEQASEQEFSAETTPPFAGSGDRLETYCVRMTVVWM